MFSAPLRGQKVFSTSQPRNSCKGIHSPVHTARKQYMSVLTRRQFLRSTGQAGIALTLATAFPPSAQVAFAHNSYALMPSENGGSVLDSPEFQKLVVNGVAPLWVAGQTVNSFAYHLNFMNLPPHMRVYFQRAGGDWKSLLQAKAVWETIPAQIRAGGPRETARFLSDKDWSHIIPKSQGGRQQPTTGFSKCA